MSSVQWGILKDNPAVLMAYQKLSQGPLRVDEDCSCLISVLPMLRDQSHVYDQNNPLSDVQWNAKDASDWESLRQRIVPLLKEYSEQGYQFYITNYRDSSNRQGNKFTGLVSKITEFLRMQDVLLAKQANDPTPCPNPILNLTAGMQGLPAVPQQPLEDVPGYLFYYPHAVDSVEPNNSVYNMGFNRNSRWAGAVRFIQGCLSTRVKMASMTPDQLRDFYKDIYMRLIRDDLNYVAGVDDRFRDKVSVVLNPDKVQNVKDCASYMKSHHPGKLGDFTNYFQLSARWIRDDLPFFPKKYRDAARILFDFPTHPSVLDREVNAFFSQLQQIASSGNYHPFQVAAFMMHGLLVLHPHPDANGRTARLFTSLYLMQCGFDPIVVFNDREFSRMFFDRSNFEGKFIQFLTDMYQRVNSSDWKDQHDEQGSLSVPNQCAQQ